jgi:AraC-like DNA-binding protein
MRKNNDYRERANKNWTEDSVRLILTPSTTAKSIFYYIQETGYFKTSYPYFTERANLNSFLLIYTISGKGHLKLGDSNYELAEGSCCFINCMDLHYYEADRKADWEFLWLHFNGANALGYYEEFSKDGLTVIDIQEQFLIESTLRRIISINQKKAPFTEALTSNLIINILTELLIQKSSHNSQSIFIPDFIRETMKYIDRNFNSRLSLESLAKNVSVSKYYLAREFKYFTASTVNEYIIITRISYAKELLKYSEEPISEITYKAGFLNVSHFINLFKARENMTPLAFRREWKGL